MAKKYRIGGLLSGQTLEVTNGVLKYQSAYGKRFAVPVSQIETVTVDSTKGIGKATLKIIGAGSELASVELPATWASKSQEWILGML